MEEEKKTEVEDAPEESEPQSQTVERWIAMIRAAEGRGAHLVAHDRALKAVKEHPRDEELRYYAILTMLNTGSRQRAREEYRKWFSSPGTFAEVSMGTVRTPLHRDVVVLPGRIDKDEAIERFRMKGDRSMFARAARRYEHGYHKSERHYFPGINAAALWFLSGREKRAHTIATEVLGQCRRLEKLHQTEEQRTLTGAHPIGDATEAAAQSRWEEQRYYVAATEAEALLILERWDELKAALKRVLKRSGRIWGRLAKTRRQLLLIEEVRRQGDVRIEEALKIPRVVQYCGHIFRANKKQEASLIPQIEGYLDAADVQYGYGCLAAGSDILIAESLLARGAELHLVFPFQVEDYVRFSVRPFGKQWEDRFWACHEQATEIQLASEDGDVADDVLFSYGSKVAMGMAMLRARAMETEVQQLVVWDQKRRPWQAGTAAEVTYWEKNISKKKPQAWPHRQSETAADMEHEGKNTAKNFANENRRQLRTAVIPFQRSGSVAAKKRRKQELDSGLDRTMMAMLFADLKGFSKLQEKELGRFQTKVMKAVAEAIGKALDGKRASETNTWGDAVYLVLENARLAARCAVNMQDALEKYAKKKLQLRVGGHFGPVYKGQDYIRNLPDVYFGSHVTRAARVEPITSPGEVFVTAAFAAQLCIEGGYDEFSCEYVGRVDLAKGYQSDFPLYLLRRRPGT